MTLQGPWCWEAVNVTVPGSRSSQSSQFLRYRTLVAVKQFLLIKPELKQSKRKTDWFLQHNFKNTELPSTPFLRTYQTAGQEKHVLQKYAHAYTALAALV